MPEKLIYLQRNKYVLDHLYLDCNSTFFMKYLLVTALSKKAFISTSVKCILQIHTLHTTHYTLHTTHYTLHTTHYPLPTAHYTLHLGPTQQAPDGRAPVLPSYGGHQTKLALLSSLSSVSLVYCRLRQSRVSTLVKLELLGF